MIQILRGKSFMNLFDIFDALEYYAETIDEDILLAHEIYFLDIVLMVDPIIEPYGLESFKSSKNIFLNCQYHGEK
jgi:hypothetical protein